MPHNLALYIASAAVVTYAIRLLPFIFFRNSHPPKMVLYIGQYLPYAIITGIVLYCFKEVNLLAYPFGAPELIAGAVVIFLQCWKHNSLISIFGGTALYMLLVQKLFIM